MNLSLLKEIDETGIGEQADFRFGEDAVLPEGLLATAVTRLHPFARTRTGSVVCLWKVREGVGPAVAWIDSEGTPTGLIASELPEFFQLLPYGSGAVYAVLSALVNLATHPALFPNNEEYLARLEADAKQQNHTTAHRAYMRLMAAHGVEVGKASLVGIVRRAFESSPGFAANVWPATGAVPPV